MKTFLSSLGLAGLTGCAVAPAPSPVAAPVPVVVTAPSASAATIGSVFGLNIGAPLTLPECPKGVFIRELEYRPASVPCVQAWKALPQRLDLREHQHVSVIFPAGQSLALHAASRVGASLIDGNLHVVTIHTRGYDVQNLVYDELVQKYGKPAKAIRTPLASGYGAISGGIQAEWSVGGLDVSFVGVSGSVRTGVVTIGTPQGISVAAERLRQAVEANRRPL